MGVACLCTDLLLELDSFVADVANGFGADMIVTDRWMRCGEGMETSVDWGGSFCFGCATWKASTTKNMTLPPRTHNQANNRLVDATTATNQTIATEHDHAEADQAHRTPETKHGVAVGRHRCAVAGVGFYWRDIARGWWRLCGRVARLMRLVATLGGHPERKPLGLDQPGGVIRRRVDHTVSHGVTACDLAEVQSVDTRLLLTKLPANLASLQLDAEATGCREGCPRARHLHCAGTVVVRDLQVRLVAGRWCLLVTVDGHRLGLDQLAVDVHLEGVVAIGQTVDHAANRLVGGKRALRDVRTAIHLQNNLDRLGRLVAVLYLHLYLAIVGDAVHVADEDGVVDVGCGRRWCRVAGHVRVGVAPLVCGALLQNVVLGRTSRNRHRAGTRVGTCRNDLAVDDVLHSLGRGDGVGVVGCAALLGEGRSGRDDGCVTCVAGHVRVGVAPLVCGALLQNVVLGRTSRNRHRAGTRVGTCRNDLAVDDVLHSLGRGDGVGVVGCAALLGEGRSGRDDGCVTCVAGHVRVGVAPLVCGALLQNVVLGRTSRNRHRAGTRVGTCRNDLAVDDVLHSLGRGDGVGVVGCAALLGEGRSGRDDGCLLVTVDGHRLGLDQLAVDVHLEGVVAIGQTVDHAANRLVGGKRALRDVRTAIHLQNNLDRLGRLVAVLYLHLYLAIVGDAVHVADEDGVVDVGRFIFARHLENLGLGLDVSQLPTGKLLAVKRGLVVPRVKVEVLSGIVAAGIGGTKVVRPCGGTGRSVTTLHIKLQVARLTRVETKAFDIENADLRVVALGPGGRTLLVDLERAVVAATVVGERSRSCQTEADETDKHCNQTEPRRLAPAVGWQGCLTASSELGRHIVTHLPIGVLGFCRTELLIQRSTITRTC